MMKIDREIQNENDGRRRFLKDALKGGSLLVIAGAAGSLLSLPTAGMADEEGEEGISPGEDLMREHGVLKRILLIYREAIRKIEAAEDFPPEAIANSAQIIRDFIEDYHEKLEENYLFPRFRKANRLVDLVDVLTAQHQGGRQLTKMTIALANANSLKQQQDKKRLVGAMKQFIRMYEPHEAREDTVLFPAIREIVSDHEYAALGEDFEDMEHDKFGEGGFAEMVDRVAAIEKVLGIYDLSQFTPTMKAGNE